MGFNRYSLVLLLFVGGGVAATAGCSNSSGGGPTYASTAAITSAKPTAVGSATAAITSAKGPGPMILTATWTDKDGDGRASKGDQVRVTFDKEVVFKATPVDATKEFALSVAGDSLGTGAVVEKDGANTTGAIVTLGDRANLKIGGAFVSSRTSAGSASGINVAKAPSGSIVSAGDGAFVREAASAVDVAGVTSATFRDGPAMVTARGAHEATLLDDGRVLISGGMRDGKKGVFCEDAELFDAITGQFQTVASFSGNAKGRMQNSKGNLVVTRIQHTATKLADGTVLITGGYGVDRKGLFGFGSPKVEVIGDAHLFDPKTNTFTRIGELNHARHSHSATLMADGRVMIAGGYSDSFWSKNKTLAPFEIYDPKTRKFTEESKWIVLHKTTVEKRMNHVAVMTDKGLLLAGGEHWEGGWGHFFGNPTLKLDKGSETYAGSDFKKNGDLVHARRYATGALMSTKQVMIAGGNDDKAALASIEQWDPSTGKWSDAAALSEARTNARVAVDGDQAFVIGGFRAGSNAASEVKKVEIFNAVTKTVDASLELKTARNGCTATRLQDGRILVAGGFSGTVKNVVGLDGQALGSCEIYVNP